MKKAILIAMLLLATSAQAEGWNESFTAREVLDDRDWAHQSRPSAKRMLRELVLVKLGILDSKSPFIAANPLDNGPEYTGKIETSYKLRLSTKRIYVGIHVRF